ncbi:MAG: tetratricopeptide repeat protein [Ignavibacteriaceae bacterium]|nr:tetratricopeptide repeat protein [Ignavibacteriaceae bacterium]
MMKDKFIPYIGPRFFEKKDKDLFFGRDYETRELCSRIIAHSVVLCYSQSGAGKTSLINAGVIPQLEKEGFNVLPVARVSGQIPKQIDPNEIKNIYMFNAMFNWSGEQTPISSLATLSMKNFLEAEKKNYEADAPLLIIFDQFEELITHFQERWTEREHFFKQVVEALEDSPRLRVVFVMREDYIAYLDNYISLFPNKMNVRFRLERMKREAAVSAILGPIKKTNIDYAEGAADLLVDELLKVKVTTATGDTITIPGEYIEPVQLQVVCQNLWNNLPEGVHTITTEYINTFGSVDDALRKFYDEAVNSVSASNQFKEQELRHWFEKHLITLAGTRGTVFRGHNQTGDISNVVIDALQSKHIIRAEYRAGGLWYELTHDSLIKAVQDSNKQYNESLNMRAEQFYLEGMQNLDKHLYKDAITALKQAIDINPHYLLAYANLSYVYNITGEFSKALESVSNAIEIDPTYVWGYNQRGIIYKNLEKNDQALADFDEAISLDNNYKWAYANKSDILKEIKQNTEALAAVNRALEIDPAYVWGYNQRGIIHKNLKEYEKALKDLDRAIELDKDYKWAYANKADVLNAMGKNERALEEINKALKIDAKYAWAFGLRGKIYNDTGKYKDALAEINRAIELGNGENWVYGNKSFALTQLGEYEKALEAINKALEIDPNDAWSCNQRGIIYKSLNEYQKALKELDKAIKLDKNYKFAYANKSDVLNIIGENEKALEAINKALEIDPKYAWAYGLRGKIYNDSAEYKIALSDIDKAIELGNNESWILGNKSYAHAQLGEYQNALKAINKSLEVDPNNAWSYNQRGFIYKNLSQLENAIKDFDEAIKADQDFYEPYGNRGETLLQLDKETEAAKDFLNVINICEKQLSDESIKFKPYFTLAWYLYRLGDYQQSIEVSEKGIALNPEIPVAHFNLGLSYLAAGYDDKAVKAYESGIKTFKGSSTFEINKVFEDAKNDIKDLALTKPIIKKTADNIIILLELSRKKVLDLL